jgi:hypothetical protein
MLVSQDGVLSIAAMGEQAAAEAGAVAEKVISVAQLAPKKRQVELKIGGMGVALFQGPKLLESFIYAQLAECKAHGDELQLAIRGAKGSQAALRFRMDEGSPTSRGLGAEAAVALMAAHQLASHRVQLERWLEGRGQAERCPPELVVAAFECVGYEPERWVSSLQTFSAGEVEAFLDDARDGRWRRLALQRMDAGFASGAQSHHILLVCW